MPDKKITKVDKLKPIKKPLESKADKFKRIAEPRTKRILNELRILGNCSNKSNYHYTKEQIDNIFDTIQERLNLIALKFENTKQEIESFKL